MQENEVSLFLYHRMTVQFLTLPLSRTHPLQGSQCSRAESALQALAARLKEGCAQPGLPYAPRVRKLLPTYLFLSSRDVQADWPPPHPELCALLPHRLHRASAAPRGRRASPPARRRHGAPSPQRLSRHLRTLTPGPAVACRRGYPLRQRPIAGGVGPREPIGQRGRSSPPIPPPQTLVAGGCLLFLLRMLRADRAWSSGTVFVAWPV